jgi:hypothetical protein
VSPNLLPPPTLPPPPPPAFSTEFFPPLSPRLGGPPPTTTSGTGRGGRGGGGKTARVSLGVNYIFRVSLFEGYPQLLSGKLQDLTDVLPLQRAVYFPEDTKVSPWIDATALKRYNLTFPFYQFRTLAPRDMHLFRQSGGQFEPSSPLFPAHTQINLMFKRRDKKDLLDFMVPEKLDPLKGSKGGTMTAADRNASLKFGGPTLSPTVPNTVRSVTVKLNDAYLVVSGLSPPAPFFFRRFSLFIFLATSSDFVLF